MIAGPLSGLNPLVKMEHDYQNMAVTIMSLFRQHLKSNQPDAFSISTKKYSSTTRVINFKYSNIQKRQIQILSLVAGIDLL
jgi:hypothetical protein